MASRITRICAALAQFGCYQHRYERPQSPTATQACVHVYIKLSHTTKIMSIGVEYTSFKRDRWREEEREREKERNAACEGDGEKGGGSSELVAK